MSTEPSTRGSAEGLRASARSLGGTLRHEVVIDGGRHVLITDEPARLGGTDSGPAPHELVPAALAACVSTTVLMYARSHGWEIGDVAVDVDYDHKATPRRFDVVVHLDPSLDPERVARLERVAAACPVRRALEGAVVVEERIELG